MFINYLKRSGITALVLLISIVTSQAAIVIHEPYIRVVGEHPMAAGFLSLENTGDQAVTITAVKSNDELQAVAARVELHESFEQNGRMSMRQVKSLAIEPQQVITLEPGGLHIMLMGIDNEQLAPGKEVALSLVVADGTEVPFVAAVINAGT